MAQWKRKAVKRKTTKRKPKIGKPTGRVFLAVDPGKTGGLTTITQAGIIISWCPMPDTILDLWHLISAMKGVDRAFLEKVHAFSGEAARASFTFGQGYGRLEAFLAAANLKTVDIAPKDWQKRLKIPPRKKKGRKFIETPAEFKKRLRGVAQRLFPQSDLWEHNMGTQMAVCDSMLIAEAGRLQELNP